MEKRSRPELRLFLITKFLSSVLFSSKINYHRHTGFPPFNTPLRLLAPCAQNDKNQPDYGAPRGVGATAPEHLLPQQLARSNVECGDSAPLSTSRLGGSHLLTRS